MDVSVILDANTGRPLAEGMQFLGAWSRSLFAGATPEDAASWTRDQNAQRFDSLLAQAGQNVRADSLLHVPEVRRDSASASAGMHLARQLEHIHRKVLEEPQRELTSFKLFPVSQEVAPGAETHTIRRVYNHGAARVYRSGEAIPRVGLSQQEATFPVRTLVSSYAYDIFAAQASAFAGTNMVARLAKGCRRVIEELHNQLNWFGSEEANLYGVFNYPWLAKKTVATPFTNASSADDILAELLALVNFPSENSGSVFNPNRMAVSQKVWNLISQKRLGTTTSGIIETVLDFFLRTNGRIKKIDIAPELIGTGPGGTDGIFLYNDNGDAITCECPQGVTFLPNQALGFDNVTHGYARTGGIVMPDVGHNILAFVTV